MLTKGATLAFGRKSFTVKEVSDERAEGFEIATIAQSAIENTVRRCLLNANIKLDEPELVQIANTVKDVTRLFRNMRDEAVTAGRKLIKLKDDHPKIFAELFRLVDGVCAMPFSPATASRMMSVAQFVDSGKVPQDRLPVAYSAAYEIVLLDSDGLLIEAEKDGLVAPSTSRSAVIAWRRERHVEDRDRIGDLMRERRRLEQRIANIDKELARRNRPS